MNRDNWVDALFQSERTRGLSGPIRPVLGLYEDEAFYSSRVWKHTTHLDLVTHPESLWTHEGPGGGVSEHLQDPLSPPDSHILIILSKDDHDRASATPGWFEGAAQKLAQGGEHPATLGVRWLRDGDPKAGIPDFLLEPGCFASGCLPNLHVPLNPETAPRWSIYAQVVGQGDAFRKVSDVWKGQRMVTFGNHWLDNVQISTLPSSCVVRLFRDSEGHFVHHLAPEFEDQFQLCSETRGQDHIVTLASREGESFVHFIVVDKQTSQAVVPRPYEHRLLTLLERGVLLQKVHFSRFMLGYDVYIDHGAQLSTVPHDPVMTVQVRRKSVSLIAHIEGASLNGEPLSLEEPVVLDSDAAIDMNGRTIHYRTFQHLRGQEGWPYVGEIRRKPLSFHLAWNETHRIGRAPGSRVALPDEGENNNIRWRPEVSEGTTILMRTGDVPKANFYTDSIMVASEHARLSFEDGVPCIECVARHCFTFVRRGEEVFSLLPTSSSSGIHKTKLQPRDEVLVGNSLFEVSYTSSQAAVAPSPAPTVERVEEAPPPIPVSQSVAPEPLLPRAPQVVSLSDAPPLSTVEALRPAQPERTLGDVVFVDEKQAQFELGRPTRLVMMGWMITGEMTCGNHGNASMIVSENCLETDQDFTPVDYFRIKVRGRKRKLTILASSEVLVNGLEATGSDLDDLGDQPVDIIRRDPDGDPDFMVRLSVVKDRRLPDPRGLVMKIDHDEPMAASLFTTGVPVGEPRTVTLGGLNATIKAVDKGIEVDGYLDSYKTSDGFHPFFIQQGRERFQAAPEDGRLLHLNVGDRMLLGNVLYQIVVG